MTGTWTPAITLSGGPKTRAARTPAEERAWADRVRAIRARADAALMAHGATAEDIAERRDGGEVGDSLLTALMRTHAMLTEEQRVAMVPASRYGDVTPGTVLDLWDGLATHGDFVLMYDEFVPIAEAVWPDVVLKQGDTITGTGPTFTVPPLPVGASVMISAHVGDGDPEWTAERLPDDPDERAALLAKRGVEATRKFMGEHR